MEAESICEVCGKKISLVDNGTCYECTREVRDAEALAYNRRQRDD
jgi:hypothetical protein